MTSATETFLVLGDPEYIVVGLGYEYAPEHSIC